MKTYRLLLLAILFISLTHKLAAQKEIFIKQIEFRLDKISDIDYENEYFMTLKLNKGSNYVFRITNKKDTYPGEAILELMDADNLIMTNVLGDKYFTAVTFQCNKTGFYDVLIKFKDNKLGYTLVDILMIQ
jgi:hypothetical protein